MRRRGAMAALVGAALAAGSGSGFGRPAEAAPDGIEREVRSVFDAWSEALTKGDKKTYLDGFWNSPRLVIRVSGSEYRGLDAYRRRVESAHMPAAGSAEYRSVEVVALGRDGAVVTYDRPAPTYMTGGEPFLFIGTVVFVRTPGGWKIAAWHAHARRGDAETARRGPH